MAMEFFYVVPAERNQWSVSHNDDTVQFFNSKEAALVYARARAGVRRPSAVIELSKAGELANREDFE